MIKEKLNSILTKIKNNKKKVIGITLGILVVFIFAFTLYNFLYHRKSRVSESKRTNSIFDDTTFDSCVINSYNSENGTSKTSIYNLTAEELQKIKTINCESMNIVSTKGIEKLTNLKVIRLKNNQIKSIDLSKNKVLEDLDLSGNQITSINLSKNTALTNLNLSDNQITSVDLSKNTFLENLNLSSNQLANID